MESNLSRKCIFRYSRLRIFAKINLNCVEFNLIALFTTIFEFTISIVSSFQEIWIFCYTFFREIPANANITATSNGSYINNTYALDRSQSNIHQQSHFVNQSQSSLNESNLNVSTTSVHNHSNSNDVNNESVENGNNPESESVSEALSQIPEARALINTLSRYTPYICILLAKSCYDHLDGILDIFALFITFAHANFVVRQEISKQVSVVELLRLNFFIVIMKRFDKNFPWKLENIEFLIF